MGTLPGSTPPPNPHAVRDFLIGLGIGAVPLALSLVAGGFLASYGNQAVGTGSTLGLTAGALYLLTLLVTIILLFVRSARAVALGMLAIVAASPAIAYLGCSVILPRLLRPGP